LSILTSKSVMIALLIASVIETNFVMEKRLRDATTRENSAPSMMINNWKLKTRGRRRIQLLLPPNCLFQPFQGKSGAAFPSENSRPLETLRAQCISKLVIGQDLDDL
jgi:hypothetical protein